MAIVVQVSACGSDGRHDLGQVLDTAALEPLITLGVLAKIGNLYLRLVPSMVDGVCSAIEAGDLETVEEVCHKLKSSNANVGAVEFSGHCRQLENAAREGDLGGCKDLSFDFAESSRMAMTALEAYLAEKGRDLT